MKPIAYVLSAVCLLALVGCDPKPTDAAADANAPATGSTAGAPGAPAGTQPGAVAGTTPSPASGGQGGVTPMTSNVGPMTPVAGAESVGGAGMGGVGSAAKGMAKGVANGPTSSLDQAGGE